MRQHANPSLNSRQISQSNKSNSSTKIYYTPLTPSVWVFAFPVPAVSSSPPGNLINPHTKFFFWALGPPEIRMTLDAMMLLVGTWGPKAVSNLNFIWRKKIIWCHCHSHHCWKYKEYAFYWEFTWHMQMLLNGIWIKASSRAQSFSSTSLKHISIKTLTEVLHLSGNWTFLQWSAPLINLLFSFGFMYQHCLK